MDSVKVELSGRYVEEFRTYGRKLAYDSLVHRVRVIKLANEHNTSDTLASTRNVEQPLSDVDRLKKENETLRNELRMLKSGYIYIGESEPPASGRFGSASYLPISAAFLPPSSFFSS